VDPEVPIHGDPQEPLADADEGGRLKNRVEGEVVKLHPVVVAQPSIKRLAGAVNPRSWCLMKLTT
jgi:hypothetical protein